ncbi:MAG: hypothetical protein QXE31_00950 [Candidatus Woesearchaeota archaeon]
MKEIIEKITKILEQNNNFEKEIKINKIEDMHEIVYNDEGKSIKIKKNNFFRLNFNINSKEKENILSKKIAFVDGGFCEILKTNVLGVFFNRIYYTIYQNNKRISNGFCEFYSYVSPYFFNDKNKKENKKDEDNLVIDFVGEKENFYFNVDLFFNEEKNMYIFNDINLRFNAFDKKISINNKFSDISLIGNAVRRFAELLTIKNINADYIVIDGSFDINYPNEEDIINNVLKESCEKNKILIGLSKSNSFFTKFGLPLNYFILNESKKLEINKFIYYLDKNQFSDIFFVKLNENSDFVFRMDICNSKNILLDDNNYNILLDNIYFLLHENSKDPIFLGYPYGLIEADMFARISNKEKEFLTFKFFSNFGNFGKELKKLYAINNTHDILDNLRF